MKRRRFLTIAGIGTLITAIAAGRFFTTPFEESAASLVREQLSFLKLDPGGLSRFVKEYSKGMDRKYKLTLKGYNILGVDASRSGKIHQLVTTYLLSTDFFIHGMDESRTIKYIALYDPYLRPCSHPFSAPAGSIT